MRITGSWTFSAAKALRDYLIYRPCCKLGKVRQNSELVAKSGLDPMALIRSFISRILFIMENDSSSLLTVLIHSILL